jgi:hypothetical protein
MVEVKEKIEVVLGVMGVSLWCFDVSVGSVHLRSRAKSNWKEGWVWIFGVVEERRLEASETRVFAVTL